MTHQKNTTSVLEVITKSKELLKTVIDPELNINIVDLGLIYDVKLINDKSLAISMTFTMPGCPMGDTIIDDIQNKFKSNFPDLETNIEISFDPPWTAERITDEGRMMLGMS